MSERSLADSMLDLLRTIQHSQKGSIGSINNVYLPQLSVEKVDRLALELDRFIKKSRGRAMQEISREEGL